MSLEDYVNVHLEKMENECFKIYTEIELLRARAEEINRQKISLSVRSKEWINAEKLDKGDTGAN